MNPNKDHLVLHICCAPDEAYVVKTLRDTHELTCFFSNPNIQPKAEYEKRLREAHRVADEFGIPFFSAPYRPEAWETAVAAYVHTPEGGERCARCFRLRLRDTARFCRENGQPRYTTVMSISPHKRIGMLNEAGAEAAEEFGVEYVSYDFKKKNGFLLSVRLSKEMGIYRQDYCGCRLSRTESEARRQQKRASQP